MSDVRDEVSDPEDAAEWTAETIAALKCLVRDDGKRTHVFLDYSNRCVCGQVDLNVYKDLVLR